MELRRAVSSLIATALFFEAPTSALAATTSEDQSMQEVEAIANDYVFPFIANQVLPPLEYPFRRVPLANGPINENALWSIAAQNFGPNSQEHMFLRIRHTAPGSTNSGRGVNIELCSERERVCRPYAQFNDEQVSTLNEWGWIRFAQAYAAGVALAAGTVMVFNLALDYALRSLLAQCQLMFFRAGRRPRLLYSAAAGDAQRALSLFARGAIFLAATPIANDFANGAFNPLDPFYSGKRSFTERSLVSFQRDSSQDEIWILRDGAIGDTVQLILPDLIADLESN